MMRKLLNDSAIKIIAYKSLSLTYKTVNIFELNLLQSGSNGNKDSQMT